MVENTWAYDTRFLPKTASQGKIIAILVRLATRHDSETDESAGTQVWLYLQTVVAWHGPVATLCSTPNLWKSSDMAYLWTQSFQSSTNTSSASMIKSFWESEAQRPAHALKTTRQYYEANFTGTVHAEAWAFLSYYFPNLCAVGLCRIGIRVTTRS